MVHDFSEIKYLRWTLKGVDISLKKKSKIFPKLEIPQNFFLKILKPVEHEFGNKKFLQRSIEGLQVDSHENFNVARWPFN